MQIRLIAITISIALLAIPDASFSQTYPVRPLRIVASGAGGGNDLVARLIAQSLTNNLGQQAIVDNHGGGVTAAEIVAKAAPDGYTFLLYGSTLWLSPFMRDKTPYDPIKDFAPVTLATRAPNVLVVHPSLPVNSVKELIALAKTEPGQLNYASGATGSSNHLAGELFNAMAGVKITRVPYKGIGPAINDLIGGYVKMSFATAGSVAAHVKANKLRALAVTSLQPSTLLPGIPAIASTGLPGYEAVAVSAIFTPTGTPVAIINRVQQEIARGFTDANVQEKFLALGVETIGSTPAELAASMKAEMTRMGKVIKDAGIREE